jgi:hypothetical protein
MQRVEAVQFMIDFPHHHHRPIMIVDMLTGLRGSRLWGCHSAKQSGSCQTGQAA